MDIYWGGQALFRIKGKGATVIVDPFDPAVTGLKLPKEMEADIALVTHPHPDHNNLKAVAGEPLEITGPGEYDVKGVAITGISVYHDPQKGEERGKNTIYNIEIDGLNIVHLGDLGHVLTEDQVQDLGNVDILMVPVGGTFTIDAEPATEVVSQLEPKIILPMHYGYTGLKYELDDVEKFLKEMGVENPTAQSKLTITKDKLPDEPIVVLLNKV
jgi:L-ascorbate metabolism protein UlaG (beta-lactamase superfamily)